jgi:hypothetical protein
MRVNSIPHTVQDRVKNVPPVKALPTHNPADANFCQVRVNSIPHTVQDRVNNVPQLSLFPRTVQLIQTAVR